MMYTTFFSVVLALAVSGASANTLPFATGRDGVGKDMNPRRLEEDMYSNNISWMKFYSIRYNQCYPKKGLVSYLLCPKGDGCRHGKSDTKHHGKHEKCDDGSAVEYLVDFETFIDAFTEAQLDAREYACEMIRENCGT